MTIVRRRDVIVVVVAAMVGMVGLSVQGATGALGAPLSPDCCPQVIATIPVGQGPTGIAANRVTNRIYVANFRESSVSVIDGSSNTVIATIPVGGGPAAVGVNAKTNRIYVAQQNG